MRLSKLKQEQLYMVVSNAIIDARVAVAKLNEGNNPILNKVDDILYKLCMKAPQDAIELFKPKSKQ